jgi:hypothetical protein
MAAKTSQATSGGCSRARPTATPRIRNGLTTRYNVPRTQCDRRSPLSFVLKHGLQFGPGRQSASSTQIPGIRSQAQRPTGLQPICIDGPGGSHPPWHGAFGSTSFLVPSSQRSGRTPGTMGLPQVQSLAVTHLSNAGAVYGAADAVGGGTAVTRALGEALRRGGILDKGSPRRVGAAAPSLHAASVRIARTRGSARTPLRQRAGSKLCRQRNASSSTGTVVFRMYVAA